MAGAVMRRPFVFKLRKRPDFALTDDFFVGETLQIEQGR